MLNADQWYPTPEGTGTTPPPLMHSWLTESGLLTARLRALCADQFRLEVLNQSGPDPDNATRRQIILCCGNKPCIYAETVIPAVTSAEFPWLSQLGDEPLGERLSSQPDVRRSPFRYRQLPITIVPVDVQTTAGYFWARSSDFHLAETALTVTEAFLPGIVSCENGKF